MLTYLLIYLFTIWMDGNICSSILLSLCSTTPATGDRYKSHVSWFMIHDSFLKRARRPWASPSPFPTFSSHLKPCLLTHLLTYLLTIWMDGYICSSILISVCVVQSYYTSHRGQIQDACFMIHDSFLKRARRPWARLSPFPTFSPTCHHAYLLTCSLTIWMDTNICSSILLLLCSTALLHKPLETDTRFVVHDSCYAHA